MDLTKKEKKPLLSSIKAAIDNILLADNQDMNTLPLTDKLRHCILNLLISYSDKIPHPASGSVSTHETTSGVLTRWQILAYVASIDLTIAKWLESHLDALSILYELGYKNVNSGLWAVWAAEGHPDPIRYQEGKIVGAKTWCSGAKKVDHGLITYRDKYGHSQLLIVDMHQPDIEINNEEWQAVGMHATDTATVQFHHVKASQVGTKNAYLERVGFWHGAAGVAACWYGATTYLADYLITASQQKPNDYKTMYLGQISTALAVTQQYFYYVANLIETNPRLSHELATRQLRSQTEMLARQVMETVGQAVGAAPFCHNAHFARLSADLPVFIRQSHGAFDLKAIGELSTFLAEKLTNEQTSVWHL